MIMFLCVIALFGAGWGMIMRGLDALVEGRDLVGICWLVAMVPTVAGGTLLLLTRAWPL